MTYLVKVFKMHHPDPIGSFKVSSYDKTIDTVKVLEKSPDVNCEIYHNDLLFLHRFDYLSRKAFGFTLYTEHERRRFAKSANFHLIYSDTPPTRITCINDLFPDLLEKQFDSITDLESAILNLRYKIHPEGLLEGIDFITS